MALLLFFLSSTATVTHAAVDEDGDGYDFDTDCNDANAEIHPGAREKFNWVDDNCDRRIDEGCNTDCN